MGIFQRVILNISKIQINLPASKRAFAAAAAAEASGGKELKLTFASPSKAIYANIAVKQIDVPGMDSNMGILPIHVPTIAVLKPGILTVHESDGNMVKFFVSSGSVSMNIDGSCQILAEEIAPVDNLDSQAAKQLLDESNRKASEPISDAEKAEAQIRAEVAEAVLKAIGGGH